MRGHSPLPDALVFTKRGPPGREGGMDGCCSEPPPPNFFTRLAALMALFNWVAQEQIELPMELHAQLRLALGDDFYRVVDTHEPEGESR